MMMDMTVMKTDSIVGAIACRVLLPPLLLLLLLFVAGLRVLHLGGGTEQCAHAAGAHPAAHAGKAGRLTSFIMLHLVVLSLPGSTGEIGLYNCMFAMVLLVWPHS
jgi:hypothetical protein